MLDGKEFMEQVADDPYLENILTVIATDPIAFPHFIVTGTTLRYKGRGVLSAASPIIPHLLREFVTPLGVLGAPTSDC